jgi:regulatory associated protein of mTOR
MNICLSSQCKHPKFLTAIDDLLTSISGTSAHTVKVFNFEGRELSRMEPYTSFLQQNRGAPISTTAFHPHRMILGCAARGDHHINLFTCAEEKPGDYFRTI